MDNEAPVREMHPEDFWKPSPDWVICPVCKGHGVGERDLCDLCEGSRVISVETFNTWSSLEE
jgi:hypothetical protein